LGKLIREYAHAHNVRPRDRWRERSVSRARDFLVASKRKTSGLPPVRSPTHDSKLRVPSTMLPPRHAGICRNSGSLMAPPQLLTSDRHTNSTSSVNRSWILDSIKVRLVLFVTCMCGLLADRTACSRIIYYHYTVLSVHLSVTKWSCLFLYI